MTHPAEHRWRRRCAPGRFVEVEWDPAGPAPLGARLAVEHDGELTLLERLRLAWRALTWASVTSRLELELDAVTAREIADTLNDFADDSDSIRDPS